MRTRDYRSRDKGVGTERRRQKGSRGCNGQHRKIVNRRRYIGGETEGRDKGGTLEETMGGET